MAEKCGRHPIFISKKRGRPRRRQCSWLQCAVGIDTAKSPRKRATRRAVRRLASPTRRRLNAPKNVCHFHPRGGGPELQFSHGAINPPLDTHYPGTFFQHFSSGSGNVRNAIGTCPSTHTDAKPDKTHIKGGIRLRDFELQTVTE